MIRASPADKIYRVAKITTLVESLRNEEIAVADALTGVGLSELELYSPDTRISLNQVIECYRNADRLSADVNFAWRTGLRFHVSTYGMYGFAILSSPSFRQAARFAVQYHQLETPVTEVTFGESGDDGKWVITPLTLPAIDSRLYRFIVELQFGTIVSLSRDVMGPSFTPKELRVTYGPMQARKNYDSAFGSPIMYGQPENAVVFNRKWLGHSPELGNELSYRETIRLCDQLLKDSRVPSSQLSLTFC